MTLLLIAALSLLALLITYIWLTSLARQKPEQYADTGPKFRLTEHLSGDMISEGVIYGPLGEVKSRFVAQMQGDLSNSGGTLQEDFKYAGSDDIQHRLWTLTFTDDTHFTATAPDVIGTARGQVSGATARLTYRIKLAEDAGGHVLNVTDWMYLMENGTIINRSEMRKIGLKVAELVATIRPVSKSPAE